MKTITTQTGYVVPQSFVTKGKQRLKQHTNTVYLNNGEEFEIELYNPTQNKVLAKIELNGKSIGSGIILRPAERVFLERYLDIAKKFLFETYKVIGTSDEVARAIVNNGGVKVSFHEEQRYLPFNYGNGTYTINNYGQFPYTTTASTFLNTNPGVVTYTSGNPIQTYNGISQTFDGSSSLFNSSVSNSGMDCSLTSTITSASTSQIMRSSINSNNSRGILRKKSSTIGTPKEIETGRVEQGSKSDQSFTYVSTSFYSYPSWTNVWKLMPLSQKLVVAEDLVTYCSECGSKRKKDAHKFCPQCGTKF